MHPSLLNRQVADHRSELGRLAATPVRRARRPRSEEIQPGATARRLVVVQSRERSSRRPAATLGTLLIRAGARLGGNPSALRQPRLG